MKEEYICEDIRNKIINLTDEYTYIKTLEFELDRTRIKAAEYKAMFFGKEELYNKISNNKGLYSKYKTLEDMLAQGILTKAEYKFCLS